MSGHRSSIDSLTMEGYVDHTRAGWSIPWIQRIRVPSRVAASMKCPWELGAVLTAKRRSAG